MNIDQIITEYEVRSKGAKEVEAEFKRISKQIDYARKHLSVMDSHKKLTKELRGIKSNSLMGDDGPKFDLTGLSKFESGTNALARSSSSLTDIFEKVTKAASPFIGQTASMGAGIANLAGVIGPVIPILGSFAAVLGVVAVKAGIVAAVFAGAGLGTLIGGGGTVFFTKLAFEAAKAGAELETLLKRLDNLAGSKELGKRLFADIFQLSQVPGMGTPEDTAQGIVNLMQQGGFNYQYAKRMQLALANFRMNSKGTNEQFNRLQYAITQLQTGGMTGNWKIQFSEAMLPIGQILQNAFGETDTQKLQKMGVTIEQVNEEIMKYMESLPKQLDNATTALENFSSAWSLAWQSIGFGVTQSNFLEPLKTLTNVLERLVLSGAAEKLGKKLGDVFSFKIDEESILEGTARVLGTMESVFEFVKSLFEKLPLMWTAAARTAYTLFLQPLASWLDMLFAPMRSMMKVFSLGKIEIPSIEEAVTELFNKTRTWDGIKDIVKNIVGGVTGIGGDALNSKIEQYRKLLNSNISGDVDDIASPFEKAEPANQVEAIAKALGVSKDNAADFGRQIFGGDDLGRMGLTAQEIGAMRKEQRITVNIQGQEGAFKAMIADVFAQFLRQYRPALQ